MHRMLARPVAEEHLQSVTAKEVVFIKDSFGSLSYLRMLCSLGDPNSYNQTLR